MTCRDVVDYVLSMHMTDTDSEIHAGPTYMVAMTVVDCRDDLLEEIPCLIFWYK
jgi:hypothetical protein